MKATIALLVAVGIAGCSPAGPPEPPSSPPAPQAARYAHIDRAVPSDPAIGWAVLDLEHGGPVGQNLERAYPQQSVFKLWLAAAVLDAVDRSEATLDERILVTRADLGFPYQPIAEKVGADGYRATLEELIRYAVIRSDNPSADLLLRRIGGPRALTAWLEGKGVRGIRIDRDERDLHAAAAEIRAATGERRAALLEALVGGARDGATPGGTVSALARLHRGEMLSAESTRRLIGILTETSTGANRLKAGLEPGWTIAHKTGTGGAIDGRSLGTNDVGLLVAPDGRVYAVAVFIAGTDLPLERCEAIIAEVARGVVSTWNAESEAGAAPSRR